MIPFRVAFRPGVPLFEQVVYAATKAIITGQLRVGDPFPSVRALSKELKINPNTAHKCVAHLLAVGLLESRPGVGTVVAQLPEASRRERTALLGREIEELVVSAKRLGVELGEMLESIATQWERLNHSDQTRGGRKG